MATLDYRPKGAAKQLFRCRAPAVVIEGGAGTGKTRAVLEYAHTLCEGWPQIRVLFVRETRKSLSETVLVTYEQKVLYPGHPALQSSGAHRTHRDHYEYPNGSYVVLGGLDNVDRIMSGEFDLICVFEATEISQESFEKLVTRLRNGKLPWQQIVLDCNPGSEFHWINQRAHRGDMARLLSRHTDNPFVDRVYLDRLGTLTGATRERLLFHRWVSEEGQILPTYDPAHNCITRAALPELKWYAASLDFGWRAPGVLQIWGFDKEDRAYRVAEVYRTEQHLDWWAERICELHKEFPFFRGVADSAEPRTIEFLNDRLSLVAGRNMPRILSAADKTKGKLHGFDQLRWALDKDASGKPRMFLVRDALRFGADPALLEKLRPTCFEQEAPSFVWLKAEDGKPAKELPDPGCADHAIDAATYLAVFAWQRDMTPPEPPKTFGAFTYGSVLGHGIEADE
jgi:hypothetical protein